MTMASGGLSAFWAQGDVLTHSVVIALVLMSLASWGFIIGKSRSALRARKAIDAIDAFWQAPTIHDAVNQLRQADAEQIFLPLAVQGVAASALTSRTGSLNAASDPSELITRTLRREINRVSARIESGLTLLASIGATAPFVGLLGTVWGIYHALDAVSDAGNVQIDKLVGPVGESLIMTAIGLMVAIPAVLAYNAFNRVNRLTLAELDAFAHDLHAHLTTGSRVAESGEGDSAHNKAA